MPTENEREDPTETQISGSQCAGDMNPNVAVSGFDGKSLVESSETESFYEKLSKLNESSGMNLVFNARQTTLDMHQFYKEVIERGGCHQVTRDGKWHEVAFALNLDGSNPNYSLLLVKLYALFLYQYEQIYYYREPLKASSTPGFTFYPGDTSGIRERKCRDNSAQTLFEDDLVGEKMFKENCHPTLTGIPPLRLPGSASAEQKQLPQLHSKSKEMKRRGSRQGARTAYHIFLKKECERLKSTHSNRLNGISAREMANNAWKCLSESERQPYIEESKKERERSAQEVVADEENQGMQNAEMEKPPALDGNFYVDLQPDTDQPSVENQSSVDLAGTMPKEAPDDPVSQIDFSN